MLHKIISVIFPKKCPYCKGIINESEYACAECISDFPKEPLKYVVYGGFCAVSSFRYEGKYREALLRLKFSNKKQYSKSFAVSIANDIAKVYNGIKFDCITSVPLSQSRLRERGYNQAEVLARDTAEILHIDYEELLEKIKDNYAQHDLAKAKRKQNVKGAYGLKDKNAVKGKTVLLIDDVVTTGYTMNACCKILIKNGAEAVYCASMLKTL